MLVGIITCSAQTVIDNFNVGPYIVDYNGQGDVKYRLRDNINLYEFFELKMDTTVIALAKEIPVKHAIQVDMNLEADKGSIGMGLEGLWKQGLSKVMYFNTGLSLTYDRKNTSIYENSINCEILEIGIPLEIEIGKLNHQYAGLYGNIGIIPAFYSVMKYDWIKDDLLQNYSYKKSGFMIAPKAEFGANIPVGSKIMRIGLTAKYKVNCTDFDIYTKGAGRFFLGAKIGLIL